VGESAAELRRDIERTREHMGETIDAIGDRVMPSRIIERRRNRVRASYWAARDAVMGHGGEAKASMGSHAAQAGSAVSEGMSHLADRVTDMPHQASRQTQGSPLGAGLIAFGAGLVLAAVIPPSEPEQQAASRIKDAAEPLVDEAKQAGRELASTLQADGRQAGEALKDAAQEAVGNVKDTAAGAAHDTRDVGAQAAHDVTGPASPAGPTNSARPLGS
jgi:hypothetical protein